MEFKNIKFDCDDGIAVITLNRPGKQNALSPDLFRELSRCLDEASGNRGVGALVITGGEDVFSAGMDVSEMVELPQSEIHSFWTFSYNQTYEKISEFRVPVIAAASGYTLAGGFDMAISCDFRVASETAKFGQLEVNVGLTPGIERLWRLVGLSRAKYLGLTGEIIGVHEAYRIGLVDRVVKSGQLLHEARAFAGKFVGKPRESLERAKQSYRVVLDMDHQAAIEWETLLLSRLLEGSEARSMLQRFLKK
jgi:enoyl-CoA hydratase/carnithine racemase